MNGFSMSCFVAFALIMLESSALAQTVENRATVTSGPMPRCIDSQSKGIIRSRRYLNLGIWNKAAFSELWNATWKRNTDIQLLLSKLCNNAATEKIMNQWLEDLGPSAVGHASNIPNRGTQTSTLPVDDSLPAASAIVDSWPPSFGDLGPMPQLGRDASELVALDQTAERLKAALERTYIQYVSTDKMASNQARPMLRQMAGPEAVARLDATIGVNSCPLKVGQPVPPFIDGDHSRPRSHYSN